MMEGLKEALQYITGLKAESMDPKVVEINGDTYCDKQLTRYHRFPFADAINISTLTAPSGLHQRKAGRTQGKHDPACGKSDNGPPLFRTDR